MTQRQDSQAGVRQRAAYHGRAAASTVEALKFELSTYGIAQLKKPRTQARIAGLSAEQMADVIAALRRVQPAHPPMSEELIELLQRMPK
jgi:hypothetical protein